MNKRKLLALTASAFVPSAIVAIVANGADASWALPYVFSVSLITAFTLGALTAFFLTRMRLSSAISYAIAGAAIGLVLSAILVHTFVGWDQFFRASKSFLALSFIVVLLSAASAFFYWILARPDTQ